MNKPLQRAVPHHPMGRVAQPDDAADMVAFPCGHDTRRIAGKTIVANGGMRQAATP